MADKRLNLLQFPLIEISVAKFYERYPDCQVDPVAVAGAVLIAHFVAQYHFLVFQRNKPVLFNASTFGVDLTS